MKHSKTFLAACALLLSACATLNPVSLYKLSQLDPVTVDPAGLALAVRSPENLAVRKNSAKMVLAFKDESHEFVFSTSLAQPEGVPSNANTRVETFTLSKGDQRRLLELQARLQHLKKSEGGDIGGSISINAQPCRLGRLPDDRLVLSIYVRTKPEEAFFPLTETLDLRKGSDSIATDFDTLPNCHEPRAGG